MERIFHIEFNFKQEKFGLFKKKRKTKFLIFLSKFMLTCCLQLQNFQICAKKFENWIALWFGNDLKLTVTTEEFIISMQLDVADNYQLYITNQEGWVDDIP